MQNATFSHEIPRWESERFQEDIAFLSEMFPACDVSTLSDYLKTFSDDPNYKSTIVNIILEGETSMVDQQLDSAKKHCGNSQEIVGLKSQGNRNDGSVVRADVDGSKHDSNVGIVDKMQSGLGNDVLQSIPSVSLSTLGRQSSEAFSLDLNDKEKKSPLKRGAELKCDGFSSAPDDDDDVVFIKSVDFPQNQSFCRTRHSDSEENSQREQSGICIRYKGGALHPSMNKSRKLQVIEIDKRINGSISHHSPRKITQSNCHPINQNCVCVSERSTLSVTATSVEEDDDLPEFSAIMAPGSKKKVTEGNSNNSIEIPRNQLTPLTAPAPAALGDLEILKKVFPEADTNYITSLLEKYAGQPDRVALVGKELTNNSNPQSVKKKAVPSVPWFWQPEENRLIQFTDAESSALEKEYLKQDVERSGPTKVNIKLPGSARRYHIDFAAMTMTCDKGQQTKIIRVLGDSEGNKLMSGKNLVPKDALAVPEGWQEQTDAVELISVRPGSAEWEHVQRSLKRSVRKAHVTNIQRVQNRWLYRKYAIQRHLIKDKNGPKCVNEKELFHGTRLTNPDVIWQSEDGFDMRHSADGMWGRGTYFASEASYSHEGFVHYNVQRKEYQLFLAHVLTGDSISLPPDRNIKMPPLKRGSSIRYDSVNGVTNGCIVYILYKLDMAYPAYLISYTSSN